MVEVSDGTTVNVNNTIQASRLLISGWPTRPGELYLAAQDVMLDALDNIYDKVWQARARLAFRAAAREAHILRD